MKLRNACIIFFVCITIGCVQHTPTRIVEYGPFIMATYQRSHKRMWCDFSLRDRVWQMPATWRMIKECVPVPKQEKPYAIVTVFDSLHAHFVRYVMAYQDDTLTIKYIGTEYDQYDWSPDQERLVFLPDPNMHVRIYDPSKNQDIETKVYTAGSYVLGVSPDYQKIITGKSAVKGQKQELFVHAIDQAWGAKKYELDTQRYSLADTSWQLVDGEYQLFVPK